MEGRKKEPALTVASEAGRKGVKIGKRFNHHLRLHTACFRVVQITGMSEQAAEQLLAASVDSSTALARIPCIAAAQPGPLASVIKRTLLGCRHVLGYNLADRSVGAANVREV